VTLLLAVAYERTGSPVLAEEQYTRALALSGYSSASGIKLAQFLIRYGRSARAMRLLEDMRLRRTADRPSLLLLARLKIEARDWEGAHEIAELLRVDDPAFEDHNAEQILAAALGGMNRSQEGIDILLSGLQQAEDPNRDDIEDELVRAYLRAGKLDEAEQLLRDRLNDAPASGRLHVLLGSVMVARGQIEKAEAAFTTAVSNGQGDVALAQLYLRTNRPVDAEKATRAGLERQPENTPLRFLLAEAREAQGDASGAIAEYEKLLQYDPTSTIAANNLASLLSARGDDPKSLQRAFDIAVRFQNSDVPQFLDTLGWIQYLRGEHQAALPLLKRAAEKLPNSGNVQFHLGLVLKAVGETKLSAAALKRSIELAPAPDAHYVGIAEAALEQISPASSTN
jgi:Tfp pilus assembly protein PilF